MCTEAAPPKLRSYYSWMAYLRGLNLTQDDLQYLFNVTSEAASKGGGDGGVVGVGGDDVVGAAVGVGVGVGGVGVGGVGVGGADESPTASSCYCGGSVKSYSHRYRAVHGHVSLFLCVFGALANALNIAVLTRKDLAGSPINRILRVLAVADLALMVEYAPFVCYMYLTTAKKDEYSHLGAVYVLLHTYVSQVLHTTSIALTLVLAMWRYVVVKLVHPQFFPHLRILKNHTSLINGRSTFFFQH